jgi:LacI family transcriptional regulator
LCCRVATELIATMRDVPKVALLVETSRGIGRELLRGIARYSSVNGPWCFHISPGDFKQAVPRIKQWGGTGIIARIPDERSAKAILKAGVPTIALGLSDEQLLANNPLSQLSEISSNPMDVARLAAEHLLECGLENFAFVGSNDRSWAARREAAFYSILSARGFQPHIYRQPARKADCLWEREEAHLAKWISELPPRVGIFACDDDRGREVLEACVLAERRVPDDIAVVGVDNDQVFCELSDPSLSSVALNAYGAGFRAAELLDGLMKKKVRKPRRILIEATGVVSRRSTDTVAVDDKHLVSAIQFIRRTNGKTISVDHVVREAALSRRALEKRFRELLGRTVHEEIQLARLKSAKRLLIETEYPISKCAKIAGFKTTGYFIQFFVKWVGKTPRRYRYEMAG